MFYNLNTAVALWQYEFLQGFNHAARSGLSSIFGTLHMAASVNPMPRPTLTSGYWHTDELLHLGFKAVGKDVSVSRDCCIVGQQNISLGDHVRIDAMTLLSAGSGYIDIGSYVHIASFCSLGGAGGITLEDFSGLSQGVRVYSASDDYSGKSLTNPCVPSRYKAVAVAPVRLERHVIVGSNSVILPGVTIGEGASVGALSLVSRSLEPWYVYFGTPARRLKPRCRDLLALEAVLRQEEGRPAPSRPD